MKYSDELREKKKHRRKLRLAIIFALWGIMFGLLVFVLFFANIFDVRTVDITSPSSIPVASVQATVDEQLDRSTLGIAHRRNSVIFSPQKLAPILVDTYPRIDQLDIRRISFHDISITIQERKPLGVWCASQCFYFDMQGIAFAEIASSSGFLFIAIEDQRDREIKLGEQVAPDDWRRNMFEVKRLLQFANISVAKIIIPQDSRGDFTVIVSEGWKIYFSNDTDINQQATNLMIFLKEKLTPAVRRDLDYVDLRIEDRIYYTQKSSFQ